jgi:hypothetical protein
LLAEAGRPVAGFGAQYLVQDDFARGLDPRAASEAIRRWQEVGGTHASVVTMGRGLTTARDHIDQLAAVRRELEAAGLV